MGASPRAIERLTDSREIWPSRQTCGGGGGGRKGRGRAGGEIWAVAVAKRAARLGRGNWLGVVEKEARRGTSVYEQACLDIHCPACRGAGVGQ